MINNEFTLPIKKEFKYYKNEIIKFLIEINILLKMSWPNLVK